MEKETDKKIQDLEPKFQEYLVQAGNPAVGSQQYNYLIRVFFFIEGSTDGLKTAREIINR